MIHDIISTFCVARGVSADDVTHESTLRDICITRYMIYAYLHNNMNVSASDIGKVFGRTRINVLRGIRVLKGWMRYHTEIKEEYHSIIKTIEGAD